MMRTAAHQRTTGRPRSAPRSGAARRHRAHAAIAIVAGLGLTLAACSSTSTSSSEAAPETSGPEVTTSTAWTQIDRGLARAGTGGRLPRRERL